LGLLPLLSSLSLPLPLSSLPLPDTGPRTYLRRIDSCITQLKAQGPSRTCYKSKEEEKKIQNAARGEQVLGRNVKRIQGGLVFKAHRLLYHSTLGSRVIKKKRSARSGTSTTGTEASSVAAWVVGVAW